METYIYGDINADIVLLQAVDDHDLEGLDNEVKLIGEMTEDPFCLKALRVGDWNNDLSPWRAPAVFGNEDFGGGAEGFLKEFVRLMDDEGRDRMYIVGGYSLAGLFALWAAFETDLFAGVAAASPSVWFPGFMDYVKDREIHAQAVYLSLGDKEARTRNSVMSKVEDNIRSMHEILTGRGTDCRLEWNPGNHFRDPDIRTAKAFSNVINGLMARKDCK